MKITYNTFDKAGNFLTSFAAVFLGLILLIGFLIFETQTLFERILPMNSWKATVASALIAIVYEFTILLFTVNSNRISKSVPIILSAVSFIFHAWFWEIWEGGPWICFFKTVVSIVLAYLNYAYSELFFQVWTDRIAIQQNAVRIKELTCEKCGRTFKSEQGLKAHGPYCKTIN